MVKRKKPIWDATYVESQFERRFNDIHRIIPETVNNWVMMASNTEILYDRMRRYGMYRVGHEAKSTDIMGRRMILLATYFGNLIIYEPIHNQPTILAVVGPDVLLKDNYIQNKNHLDLMELHALLNVDYTSRGVVEKLSKAFERVLKRKGLTG